MFGPNRNIITWLKGAANVIKLSLVSRCFFFFASHLAGWWQQNKAQFFLYLLQLICLVEFCVLTARLNHGSCIVEQKWALVAFANLLICQLANLLLASLLICCLLVCKYVACQFAKLLLDSLVICQFAHLLFASLLMFQFVDLLFASLLMFQFVDLLLASLLISLLLQYIAYFSLVPLYLVMDKTEYFKDDGWSFNWISLNIFARMVHFSTFSFFTVNREKCSCFLKALQKNNSPVMYMTCLFFNIL